MHRSGVKNNRAQGAREGLAALLPTIWPSSELHEQGLEDRTAHLRAQSRGLPVSPDRLAMKRGAPRSSC